MSPTCSRKDKMVVPNRLVFSLLPDSMRLSTNIGFSYIRPLRELRHRTHPLCSRTFGAFASANSCPCGQVNDLPYPTQQFAQKLTFCTSGHPSSDAVSCSKIRPI